jgi:Family of unknown function (DUF5990)
MVTRVPSEIPVRITVRRPPPGVAFAIQRGRDELLPATRRSAAAWVFDFRVGVVTARSGGAPSLRGPYVQGPAGARFIYLNSGTRAAQPDSAWNRRAKLPLTDISEAMITAALRSPATGLEVEVEGAAKDGGPVFATIKSIDWRVIDGSTDAR